MKNGYEDSGKPLVLVAEADDSSFKLIQAIIGKKCEIKRAKTGEDIVHLYRQHGERIDAILTEIKMPAMNGLEATRIIREKDRRTPIIVQTVYAFEQDLENALNAGVTEVLVKPITHNVLRTAINRYLPHIEW